MTNEIWKSVNGYEGLYEISSNGRLKSLARKCKINKYSFRVIEESIITEKRLPKGYLFATIYKNNIPKRMYIHRIVAQTFIPNIENKPQVNHKDGNKSNNSVDNLEWATASENLSHALRTNLRFTRKGKESHMYGKVAANAKIVLDLETGIFYTSACEAAKAQNVKYPTMASWLHGRGSNCKRFTHV